MKKFNDFDLDLDQVKFASENVSNRWTGIECVISPDLTKTYVTLCNFTCDKNCPASRACSPSDMTACGAKFDKKELRNEILRC